MRGHPDWCAGGHRCGLGEHRSAPQTWHTTYGRLVVTRVRGVDGTERMEISASVRLEPDPTIARRQGQLLAVGVDTAVRRAVAGQLPSAA